MSPEFKKLFSQHAGTAFAKQLAFADFLGERGWGVDLHTGMVTFGSDLVYPLQLLGSESDGDGSWLWAWANDASNLPKPLLENANQLKNLGEKEGISELVERSFLAKEVNGHMLSMVASGMVSGSCYYRGPYSGGALYFLVRDIPNEIISPVNPERAITVISQVIAQFEVDHQLFVESFLAQQNFNIEQTSGGLTATRDNNSIIISLNEHRQVSNISGSLAANSTQQVNKKKKPWQFWQKR